jgi:hypothetical protein
MQTWRPMYTSRADRRKLIASKLSEVFPAPSWAAANPVKFDATANRKMKVVTKDDEGQ